MPNISIPAAATGLPIAIIPAELPPGLANRVAKLALPTAAETAAAMNAVQVALNAILAEGGAHA